MRGKNRSRGKRADFALLWRGLWAGRWTISLWQHPSRTPTCEAEQAIQADMKAMADDAWCAVRRTCASQ